MKSNIPVLLPFGKTIFQTAHGQSITSDTKFIVDTILNKFTDDAKTVLELGCGNGIISIMLAHYRHNWKIAGIDIQPHLIELAKKNADLAGIDADFICDDIKSFHSKEGYGLIMANPPYYPAGAGKISPIEERAISRHELKCDMMDVLSCVKRNLVGKAYVIYPGSRFAELKKIAKKVDLKIAAKFILNAENSEDKELFELKMKSKILVELAHA